MGSNWSFGPSYNNATINFLILNVLCCFLFLLERSIKHQNLTFHKFYLLKLTCKLYNPLFRVIFHQSDGISRCNFLLRMLWRYDCMRKRPGKSNFSWICAHSLIQRTVQAKAFSVEKQKNWVHNRIGILCIT